MQLPHRSEGLQCVALTGASGHVGAAIARELLDRGLAIRLLARSPDDRSLLPLMGESVTICRGSLEDAKSLKTLVEGAQAAIHCAALVSLSRRRADEVHRVNVEGTRSVLAAAQAGGLARFVHVSSVHSYGPSREPVNETAQRLELGHDAPAYDKSKAEAEALVLADHGNLETLLVQPSSVIGPFDYKPSRLGKVLLAVARGRLPATLPGSFDFVDNRDVAHGVVQALLHGGAGESYLLTGHHLRVQQLVQAAAEAAKRRPPRFVVPTWVARAVAPVVEVGAAALGKEPTLTNEGLQALASGVRFSHEKASRELEYRARPLDETLRDTVSWFRQEGAL